VTRSGCGAICPAFGRGCYGCFGPREQPNVPALLERFEASGLSADAAARTLAGFNAWAEPLRPFVPSGGGERPASASVRATPEVSDARP
jgi:hypothetical protein